MIDRFSVAVEALIMKPSFSVLVNNFNYGDFLSDCLDSLMAQNWEHLEVIVYDDGSTDSSNEILEKYEKQVLVIREKNYGGTPNQNQANSIYQAFLRSSGDWICLLDSDDVFLEGKLKAIADSITGNPKAAVFQHAFKEIDKYGCFTGRYRPFLANVDIDSHVQRTHNLLFLFTQTSGLVFSRKYLEEALPLCEDSRDLLWADARLTRGAIGRGEIVTIRKPLGGYRVHGSNDSAKLADKTVLREAIRQQYEYFNELQLARGLQPIGMPDFYGNPKQSAIVFNVWKRLKIFGIGNAVRYALFRLPNVLRPILKGGVFVKKV